MVLVTIVAQMPASPMAAPVVVLSALQRPLPIWPRLQVAATAPPLPPIPSTLAPTMLEDLLTMTTLTKTMMILLMTMTMTVQRRSIGVIGPHLPLTNFTSWSELSKNLIIQTSIPGRSSP